MYSRISLCINAMSASIMSGSMTITRISGDMFMHVESRWVLEIVALPVFKYVNEVPDGRIQTELDDPVYLSQIIGKLV